MGDNNYVIDWKNTWPSLVAVLLGIMIWGGIAIMGFVILPEGVENENFRSLIIIIWAIVMINLIRIIPHYEYTFKEKKDEV